MQGFRGVSHASENCFSSILARFREFRVNVAPCLSVLIHIGAINLKAITATLRAGSLSAAHPFYTTRPLVRFPYTRCGAACNRARMSYSRMMQRSEGKLHSSSSPRNNITRTVPCISCSLSCGTVPYMEISLSQEHPYTSD